MALTTNHPAGRRSRHPAFVVLVLVLTLFSACSPAAVERSTPSPVLSISPTPNVDVLETPLVPTPIVASGPRIERVAIATRIDSDDAPLEETSVVSEWPELIYLCVLMSEIPESTRLRAYWFQNDSIVAQSDMSPPPSNGAAAWVALRYRPVARLDPAAEYAVELRINNDLIDRFMFRVGAGNPADAIAELAFASGFDPDGNPIDPRTHFLPGESPLTLRMRISYLVNPANMAFTSLWYRGDAQIARIDGVLSSGEADPDPRQFQFEYFPTVPLSQGQYRVVILMNGKEIRTARFSVTTEPEPTPVMPTAPAEPSPSPTPTESPPDPTATPVPSTAEIEDVAITTEIDQGNAAPVGPPLFEIERPAGSIAELWMAIEVEDITPSDTIEVVILRDGQQIERRTAPSVSRESGWISTEFGLEVPPQGDTFIYTFQVLLNGEEALATTLRIEGT